MGISTVAQGPVGRRGEVSHAPCATRRGGRTASVTDVRSRNAESGSRYPARLDTVISAGPQPAARLDASSIRPADEPAERPAKAPRCRDDPDHLGRGRPVDTRPHCRFVARAVAVKASFDGRSGAGQSQHPPGGAARATRDPARKCFAGTVTANARVASRAAHRRPAPACQAGATAAGPFESSCAAPDRARKIHATFRGARGSGHT